MSDPSEPRQPPRPPQFTPPPDYPPTAQFPPVGPDPHTGYAQPPPYDPSSGYPPQPPYDPNTGYPPPGYGQPPGYGPAPRPPRRSNMPLIALVLAVTLLLCGGVVTASVILVGKARDTVEKTVDDVTQPLDDPTLPALPTDAPDLPALPTDFPDLPALPTDIPGLGEGKEITVTYEVTGDGPAEIIYMEKLDGAPKRVGNASLPWKITTTMKSPSVVSVIAVRSSIESGSISCRASVDGKQVAEKTAEGGLATANCYELVLY
ncbi:MmpS family transport accessory protein [Actinoplanes subglobosus]|uniref:MmpS family transport accessory protein n=1 Tax=Actinoplanes subglobosus TaxID=1547892 RepID=A0ABV8IRG6_9ACTN